jgi:mycoredoxin
MTSSNPLDRNTQHPLTAAPSAPRATPGGEILVYSTAWCGACRRAMQTFANLGVPYTSVDIEEDDDAAHFVARLNGGMRSVPTIVFPDGSVLVEPSSAELETKLSKYATP